MAHPAHAPSFWHCTVRVAHPVHASNFWQWTERVAHLAVNKKHVENSVNDVQK